MGGESAGVDIGPRSLELIILSLLYFFLVLLAEI